MSGTLIFLTISLAICCAPILGTDPNGFDERYPEENPDLFEGDIELDGESPFDRNAVGDRRRLWPNGIVPYEISSYFNTYDKTLFRAAMKEIEMVTGSCIKFVPRTSTHHYYVKIITGQGCHSSIGFRNRLQTVTLGHGCVRKGIAMHELLHALGFFHEQSRPDRDQFITVVGSNIIKGRENNFKIFYPPTLNTQGFPYDYDSLMHYGAHAFAKDRSKPTIIPRRIGARIGQRSHLSSIDIMELKKLYRC
ncbi:zinc metalloproteinase nas-15-like isoform X1 [Octopus sinensis]|uniref:Metalloendopeptidase n=1 Tax=Octopus sinensis TaxID=2607531 RepID=A0A6P7S7E3_9MOLL|nr:zinc metalloproteinase nas-15-like isoform X1 [Octopus sinensis]